jgi:hypothetical protein
LWQWLWGAGLTAFSIFSPHGYEAATVFMGCRPAMTADLLPPPPFGPTEYLYKNWKFRPNREQTL